MPVLLFGKSFHHFVGMEQKNIFFKSHLIYGLSSKHLPHNRYKAPSVMFIYLVQMTYFSLLFIPPGRSKRIAPIFCMLVGTERICIANMSFILVGIRGERI